MKYQVKIMANQKLFYLERDINIFLDKKMFEYLNIKYKITDCADGYIHTAYIIYSID